MAEAESRARASYAELGRYYHDQQHLDHCLMQLASAQALAERQRRLLRWAVLWHDAVYDPARTDNEERSAERARRELLACGVSNENADEVARLILLTKDHHVSPGDDLGALLVSIDLSVLGAAPDQYEAYVRGVRKEYAHVPEEGWRIGRAAVLRGMLEAAPLYPEPSYRQALEATARRNMSEELKRLSEG